MGFLFGLLTGIFAFVATLAIVVVHVLKLNLDLPETKATNTLNRTSDEAVTVKSNDHDFSDISEARLRQMIQKIVAETMSLPPLRNGQAVSEIAIDKSVQRMDKHSLSNNSINRRHRTEQYFEPIIYQDLLATAVLNKIVDKQLKNIQKTSERQTVTGDNDLNDNFRDATTDQNLNDEKLSTSSGSSVEPQSDCSYPEVEQIFNNNDNRSSELLRNSDRDSVMSDYLANHMIPLPDLNAITTESEDDDYTSITSSAVGDGTWEKNWLFKKKRSALSVSVTTSSIGMLVPDPKEDVRAQIGDKTADEVSDLSELGSDSDDSLNSLRSQLEPINDRFVNKHLIGGQNSKIVLDELIERSSMISNTFPNDAEPIYTDTCNEHIIDAKTKNEAINDNFNQQTESANDLKIDSEVLKDLNSNSLTANDDISESEGCTGFSAVEIFESSGTPSVVEILAAMALGPMLAVPSIDQPVPMTVSDFNVFTELKELALAEIKAHALTSRNLDVILEESGDVINQTENVNISSPEELDFHLQESEKCYKPFSLKEIAECETETETQNSSVESFLLSDPERPKDSTDAHMNLKNPQSINDEQVVLNTDKQETQVKETALNEGFEKSQNESTKYISDKSAINIDEITHNLQSMNKEMIKEHTINPTASTQNTLEELSRASFGNKIISETQIEVSKESSDNASSDENLKVITQETQQKRQKQQIGASSEILNNTTNEATKSEPISLEESSNGSSENISKGNEQTANKKETSTSKVITLEEKLKDTTHIISIEMTTTSSQNQYSVPQIDVTEKLRSNDIQPLEHSNSLDNTNDKLKEIGKSLTEYFQARNATVIKTSKTEADHKEKESSLPNKQLSETQIAQSKLVSDENFDFLNNKNAGQETSENILNEFMPKQISEDQPTDSRGSKKSPLDTTNDLINETSVLSKKPYEEQLSESHSKQSALFSNTNSTYSISEKDNVSSSNKTLEIILEENDAKAGYSKSAVIENPVEETSKSKLNPHESTDPSCETSSDIVKESSQIEANLVSDSTNIAASEPEIIEVILTEIKESHTEDKPAEIKAAKSNEASCDTASDIAKETSQTEADLVADSTNIAASEPEKTQVILTEIKELHTEDHTAEIKAAESNKASCDTTSDIAKETSQTEADLVADSTNIAASEPEKIEVILTEIKKSHTEDQPSELKATESNEASCDTASDTAKETSQTEADLVADSTNIAANEPEKTEVISTEIKELHTENQPAEIKAAESNKASCETSSDTVKESSQIETNLVSDSTNIAASEPEKTEVISTEIKELHTEDQSAEIKADESNEASCDTSSDIATETLQTESHLVADSTNIASSEPEKTEVISTEIKELHTKDQPAEIKSAECNEASCDTASDIAKETSQTEADLIAESTNISASEPEKTEVISTEIKELHTEDQSAEIKAAESSQACCDTANDIAKETSHREDDLAADSTNNAASEPEKIEVTLTEIKESHTEDQPAEIKAAESNEASCDTASDIAKETSQTEADLIAESTNISASEPEKTEVISTEIKELHKEDQPAEIKAAESNEASCDTASDIAKETSQSEADLIVESTNISASEPKKTEVISTEIKELHTELHTEDQPVEIKAAESNEASCDTASDIAKETSQTEADLIAESTNISASEPEKTEVISTEIKELHKEDQPAEIKAAESNEASCDTASDIAKETSQSEADLIAESTNISASEPKKTEVISTEIKELHTELHTEDQPAEIKAAESNEASCDTESDIAKETSQTDADLIAESTNISASEPEKTEVISTEIKELHTEDQPAEIKAAESNEASCDTASDIAKETSQTEADLIAESTNISASEPEKTEVISTEIQELYTELPTEDQPAELKAAESTNISASEPEKTEVISTEIKELHTEDQSAEIKAAESNEASSDTASDIAKEILQTEADLVADSTNISASEPEKTEVISTEIKELHTEDQSAEIKAAESSQACCDTANDIAKETSHREADLIADSTNNAASEPEKIKVTLTEIKESHTEDQPAEIKAAESNEASCDTASDIAKETSQTEADLIAESTNISASEPEKTEMISTEIKELYKEDQPAEIKAAESNEASCNTASDIAKETSQSEADLIAESTNISASEPKKTEVISTEIKEKTEVISTEIQELHTEDQPAEIKAAESNEASCDTESDIAKETSQTDADLIAESTNISASEPEKTEVISTEIKELHTEDQPAEIKAAESNEASCDTASDIAKETSQTEADLIAESTNISASEPEKTEVISTEIQELHTELPTEDQPAEIKAAESTNISASEPVKTEVISTEIKELHTEDQSAEIKAAESNEASSDTASDIAKETSQTEADLVADSTNIAASKPEKIELISTEIKELHTEDQPAEIKAAESNEASSDTASDIAKETSQTEADLVADSTKIAASEPEKIEVILTEIKELHTEDHTAEIKAAESNEASCDTASDTAKETSQTEADLVADSTNIAASEPEIIEVILTKIKKSRTEDQPLELKAAESNEASCDTASDIVKEPSQTEADLVADSTNIAASEPEKTKVISTEIKKSHTGVQPSELKAAESNEASCGTASDIAKEISQTEADLVADSTNIAASEPEKIEVILTEIKKSHTEDKSSELKAAESNEASCGTASDIAKEISQTEADLVADSTNIAASEPEKIEVILTEIKKSHTEDKSSELKAAESNEASCGTASDIAKEISQTEADLVADSTNIAASEPEKIEVILTEIKKSHTEDKSSELKAAESNKASCGTASDIAKEISQTEADLVADSTNIAASEPEKIEVILTEIKKSHTEDKSSELKAAESNEASCGTASDIAKEISQTEADLVADSTNIAASEPEKIEVILTEIKKSHTEDQSSELKAAESNEASCDTASDIAKEISQTEADLVADSTNIAASEPEKIEVILTEIKELHTEDQPAEIKAAESNEASCDPANDIAMETSQTEKTEVISTEIKELHTEDQPAEIKAAESNEASCDPASDIATETLQTESFLVADSTNIASSEPEKTEVISTEIKKLHTEDQPAEIKAAESNEASCDTANDIAMETSQTEADLIAESTNISASEPEKIEVISTEIKELHTEDQPAEIKAAESNEASCDTASDIAMETSQTEKTEVISTEIKELHTEDQPAEIKAAESNEASCDTASDIAKEISQTEADLVADSTNIAASEPEKPEVISTEIKELHTEDQPAEIKAAESNEAFCDTASDIAKETSQTEADLIAESTNISASEPEKTEVISTEIKELHTEDQPAEIKAAESNEASCDTASDIAKETSQTEADLIAESTNISASEPEKTEVISTEIKELHTEDQPAEIKAAESTNISASEPEKTEVISTEIKELHTEDQFAEIKAAESNEACCDTASDIAKEASQREADLVADSTNNVASEPEKIEVTLTEIKESHTEDQPSELKAAESNEAFCDTASDIATETLQTESDLIADSTNIVASEPEKSEVISEEIKESHAEDQPAEIKAAGSNEASCDFAKEESQTEADLVADSKNIASSEPEKTEVISTEIKELHTEDQFAEIKAAESNEACCDTASDIATETSQTEADLVADSTNIADSETEKTEVISAEIKESHTEDQPVDLKAAESKETSCDIAKETSQTEADLIADSTNIPSSEPEKTEVILTEIKELHTEDKPAEIKAAESNEDSCGTASDIATETSQTEADLVADSTNIAGSETEKTEVISAEIKESHTEDQPVDLKAAESKETSCDIAKETSQTEADLIADSANIPSSEPEKTEVILTEIKELHTEDKPAEIKAAESNEDSCGTASDIATETSQTEADLVSDSTNIAGSEAEKTEVISAEIKELHTEDQHAEIKAAESNEACCGTASDTAKETSQTEADLIADATNIAASEPEKTEVILTEIKELHTEDQLAEIKAAESNEACCDTASDIAKETSQTEADLIAESTNIAASEPEKTEVISTEIKESHTEDQFAEIKAAESNEAFCDTASDIAKETSQTEADLIAESTNISASEPEKTPVISTEIKELHTEDQFAEIKAAESNEACCDTASDIAKETSQREADLVADSTNNTASEPEKIEVTLTEIKESHTEDQPSELKAAESNEAFSDTASDIATETLQTESDLIADSTNIFASEPEQSEVISEEIKESHTEDQPSELKAAESNEASCGTASEIATETSQIEADLVADSTNIAASEPEKTEVISTKIKEPHTEDQPVDLKAAESKETSCDIAKETSQTEADLIADSTNIASSEPEKREVISTEIKELHTDVQPAEIKAAESNEACCDTAKETSQTEADLIADSTNIAASEPEKTEVISTEKQSTEIKKSRTEDQPPELKAEESIEASCDTASEVVKEASHTDFTNIALNEKTEVISPEKQIKEIDKSDLNNQHPVLKADEPYEDFSETLNTEVVLVEEPIKTSEEQLSETETNQSELFGIEKSELSINKKYNIVSLSNENNEMILEGKDFTNDSGEETLKAEAELVSDFSNNAANKHYKTDLVSPEEQTKEIEEPDSEDRHQELKEDESSDASAHSVKDIFKENSETETNSKPKQQCLLPAICKDQFLETQSELVSGEQSCFTIQVFGEQIKAEFNFLEEKSIEVEKTISKTPHSKESERVSFEPVKEVTRSSVGFDGTSTDVVKVSKSDAFIKSELHYSQTDFVAEEKFLKTQIKQREIISTVQSGSLNKTTNENLKIEQNILKNISSNAIPNEESMIFEALKSGIEKTETQMKQSKIVPNENLNTSNKALDNLSITDQIILEVQHIDLKTDGSQIVSSTDSESNPKFVVDSILQISKEQLKLNEEITKETSSEEQQFDPKLQAHFESRLSVLQAGEIEIQDEKLNKNAGEKEQYSLAIGTSSSKQSSEADLNIYEAQTQRIKSVSEGKSTDKYSTNKVDSANKYCDSTTQNLTSEIKPNKTNTDSNIIKSEADVAKTIDHSLVERLKGTMKISSEYSIAHNSAISSTSQSKDLKNHSLSKALPHADYVKHSIDINAFSLEILEEPCFFEETPTTTRQSTVVETVISSKRLEDSLPSGNLKLSKKLQRQYRVIDTTPSFEDISPKLMPQTSPPSTSDTLASLCQQFIHDKHLLTALENRRRRTLLMHRFLSTLDLSHSTEDCIEETNKTPTEVFVTEKPVVYESLTRSCDYSSDHDDCNDSFILQINEPNNISYNFINTVLFSDQLSNESNPFDGSQTSTVEEYLENGNEENNILILNLNNKPTTNTFLIANTNASSETNSKANTNSTNSYNHKQPVTCIPPSPSDQRNLLNSSTSAVQNNDSSRHFLKNFQNNEHVENCKGIYVTVCTDSSFVGDNDDDKHEDDEDDVVRLFVPGSIAEREYKKWNNAVEMPNNPYAPEALKRRISGSQERFIDLPNISPTKELKPLTLLNEPGTEADNDVKLENDYKRYSRDYYINSSLTKAQISPARDLSALDVKENRELTKITTSSSSTKAEIETDVYKAIPCQVIEVSSSRMETTSPTPTEAQSYPISISEDSDTIKINAIEKEKHDKNTDKINAEEKSPSMAFTKSDSSGNVSAPIRGSTPVGFKFLQPKRKLLEPNQVLTVAEDEPKVASSQFEKVVIEEDVVKALPSVKALARAFLITTRSTQPEKLWLRKARTLSQGGKKLAASPKRCLHQLTMPERHKPEDDVTITSDLSSLETDSSSMGVEFVTTSNLTNPAASSSSPDPVRQGVLRNNIAFFENLKNK